MMSSKVQYKSTLHSTHILVPKKAIDPYSKEFQINLEVEVETQRITTILDHMFEGLDIAVCLPILLHNNGSKLKTILGAKELQLVTAYCQYPDGFQNKESEDSDKKERLDGYAKHSAVNKNHLKTQPNWGRSSATGKVNNLARQYPDVCRAIQLLNSTFRLKQFVIPELLPQISSNTNDFLDCMHRLHNTIIERLLTLQQDNHAHIEKLRCIWKQNKQAKYDVAKLQTMLDTQRTDSKLKIHNKNIIIKKLQDQIESVKKQSKDEIKKKCIMSERNMVEAWKDSVYKQRSLKVEQTSVANNFATLLADHLKHEQQLRAKTYKLQSQLQTMIDKYDNSMGEIQAEIDEVLDKYRPQRKKRKELQVQFDIQEEEYNVLMAEKEEYEQQLLNEKLYKLKLNRSARKIQRYWRAHWARKLARRRARQRERQRAKQSKKEPIWKRAKSKSKDRGIKKKTW